MGAQIDDGLRRVMQESGSTEAGVALAAVGIEDPELGPPTRRAEAVPGDRHLRPLADDIPAEPDPVASAELEAERGGLGDGPGKDRAKTGWLEDHETGLCPSSECGETSQAIGKLTRPTGSPSWQVEDEQVDRPTGQQRAADGKPLVEGRRIDYHEPFQPDAAGDRLDRVETPPSIQPGNDGSRGLCLGDDPESDGRLAR